MIFIRNFKRNQIKTIRYSVYDSRECHDYRATEEYSGEITILAEKDALSKVDCSKKMPSEIQKMLIEIYSKDFL